MLGASRYRRRKPVLPVMPVPVGVGQCFEGAGALRFVRLPCGQLGQYCSARNLRITNAKKPLQLARFLRWASGGFG